MSRRGHLLYDQLLVSSILSRREVTEATRYDMDFQGNFYPLCNFVRSAAIAALDG
jgi:hypothetical protein